VKLTTGLNLVASLRIIGAKPISPPPSDFMACTETNLRQTNSRYFSVLGKYGKTHRKFERGMPLLNGSTNTVTPLVIMGNSSLHLRLSFPYGAFPSGLTTRILHTFIISPCMLHASQFSAQLFDSTAILTASTNCGAQHFAIDEFM